MKPPCVVDAGSPDPNDAHVDLVLDLDKFSVNAFFRKDTSASISWTNVNRLPGKPPAYFISYTEIRRRWYNPNRWLQAMVWPMILSAPRSLTTFAALLAGRKHVASRDEWLAHLAGEPGFQFGRWGQLRAVLGFVAAAVRFRAEDAAEMAWKPVDAVLASRTLSNLLVWGLVGVVLVAIVRHDGRFGLVADIQDPVALGIFLFAAIRVGRWWRGIEPPEPKRRRTKE